MTPNLSEEKAILAVRDTYLYKDWPRDDGWCILQGRGAKH